MRMGIVLDSTIGGFTSAVGSSMPVQALMVSRHIATGPLFASFRVKAGPTVLYLRPFVRAVIANEKAIAIGIGQTAGPPLEVLIKCFVLPKPQVYSAAPEKWVRALLFDVLPMLFAHVVVRSKPHGSRRSAAQGDARLPRRLGRSASRLRFRGLAAKRGA